MSEIVFRVGDRKDFPSNEGLCALCGVKCEPVQKKLSAAYILFLTRAQVIIIGVHAINGHALSNHFKRMVKIDKQTQANIRIAHTIRSVWCLYFFHAQSDRL
ncbi:hypothetical protein AcW2_001333 [Taiwanofungus camphoratus]|nr:hypothetical protein AcW2_001333 [Antrodia cinnamomea]